MTGALLIVGMAAAIALIPLLSNENPLDVLEFVKKRNKQRALKDRWRRVYKNENSKD